MNTAHIFIKTSLVLLMAFCVIGVSAQTASVIIPSNISTGSLEKNLLFNAPVRYQVTRTGPNIGLANLFDGKFNQVMTSSAPTAAVPLVILIEGLPAAHTQAAAWVGWSTRFWYAKRFKIEGYKAYDGINQWVTVADVSGNLQRHYMVGTPAGAYSKLRFTFYEAVGDNGILQLSELFFLHPEAGDAYDGLLVKYSSNNNVGIGTSNPQAKLAVNGNILATEIKVKTDISVPDYVFEPNYKMLSLSELESFVKSHKHLPEIPSAKEIGEKGLDLAEMNLLLLKKVEELTLHLIEKEKKEKSQDTRLTEMEDQIKKIITKQ